MQKVSNGEAFYKIRELILEKINAESFVCESNPSFERFRKAFLANRPNRSIDEICILLRQIIIFSHTLSENTVIQVPINNKWPLSENEWLKFGLKAEKVVTYWHVSSIPWSPNWIPDSENGVDTFSSQELERRTYFTNDQSNNDNIKNFDPFLLKHNFNAYRSRDQRDAVRTALSMPPGASLIISLPTGEGKSRVFQALCEPGFVNNVKKGIILVIVPTVTLALDHEKSFSACFNLTEPLAYVGGREEKNKLIYQKIAEGSQKICFLSPEAACGPLRKVIIDASQQGKISALVIDEAHLVESWGGGFRSVFQTLSGLRHNLLTVAPRGKEPRTIMLSATLNQTAFDTLKLLFTSNDYPQAFTGSIKLRPEIEFWATKPDSDESQKEKVLEALYHLPRPAILYVTEVEVANEWFLKLKTIGFKNLSLVHGKTQNEKREAILTEWKEGNLDLVIATAAFGLGIDYPNVRSVIHACVPETLDRFYQEVGRGGRDGKSCLSLIIPNFSDINIAESLNRKKIISIKRGIQRWRSMFNSPEKKRVDFDTYKISLNVSPSQTEEDIDMVNSRNSDWNSRVLNIMTLSGLIRLIGIDRDIENNEETGENEEIKEYHKIQILEHGHLDENTWERLVKPTREKLDNNNFKSLELMKEFFNGNKCVSELFAELYSIHINGEKLKVNKNCGGCNYCRKTNNTVSGAEIPISTEQPWPSSKLSPLGESFIDEFSRLAVIYNSDINSRSFKRGFFDMLKNLIVFGFNKIVICGNFPINTDEIINLCQDYSIFFCKTKNLAFKSLPFGPEIVLIGPETLLSQTYLQPGKETEPKIFFLPETIKVSNQLDFYENYHGKKLKIDEFMEKVLR